MTWAYLRLIEDGIPSLASLDTVAAWLLLVTLIILFAVEWNIIFRSHGQFKVYEQMSPVVGILRLFPGITPQTVSQCYYLY